MSENVVDNYQAQMRKGILDFCILLIISKDKVYASDILEELKSSDLLVVEGTLYPLLSRLKASELVSYEWVESESGPPRKYYSLTSKGRGVLKDMKVSWLHFNKSINSLIKNNEKSN